MKKLLIFILINSFITTVATAKDFKVKNYNRYLELIGVVGPEALDFAAQINTLSKASSEEITLLINSPGGSVAHGMIVVDSMRQAKAKGVKFKCVVPLLAASMAYIILAECNDRYAFSNTLLLWHQISLSVRGAKIKPLYDSLLPLLDLQSRVDKDLIKVMKTDSSFYNKHSEAETFWSAAELKNSLNNDFIKIINSADIKTDNLYRFMKPEFNPFNISTGFDDVDKILKRMLIREL